jgi:hypothetical protein
MLSCTKLYRIMLRLTKPTVQTVHIFVPRGKYLATHLHLACSCVVCLLIRITGNPTTVGDSAQMSVVLPLIRNQIDYLQANYST